MNWKLCLKEVFNHPPHIVVRKALYLVSRECSDLIRKKKDVWFPTYEKLPFDSPALFSYFPKPPPEKLAPSAKQLSTITGHYLERRFDLLGSGWVQVRHGMNCQGVEGHRYPPCRAVQSDPEGNWLSGRINPGNLSESQRIWRIVDPDYIPIDWHLDFKSGYRWSESAWQSDVSYGDKLGVDIKVPWELARMQHLPQLAFAFHLAHSGHPEFKEPGVYAKEFKNQILDFTAANPPRYGVNWSSAMDVGIRAANWLVAYDLFTAAGASFDESFKNEFARAVYDHGRHIINHLEWNSSLRSNHYLANIAGLLFVAAYLPRSPETDAWLAFAVQELTVEMETQFHPDGTNFEASTSYHRLSAEMMVYSAALIVGLPEKKRAALEEYNHRLIQKTPKLQRGPLSIFPIPGSGESTPLPPEFIEKLEPMAEFSLSITKPNQRIAQIGDNDSGRFLKLQPLYVETNVKQIKERFRNLRDYEGLSPESVYWKENHLDHRHLVASICGLFDRKDLSGFAGEDRIETDIIKHLSRGIQFPSRVSPGETPNCQKVRKGNEAVWKAWNQKFTQFPDSSRQIYAIPIPGGNLREDLTLSAFPDFGLYLFKSNRLFLSVRLGPIGQNGYGGHAHNDQLSMELCVDGKDIIRDPGTYLYTPLPERRNEYRSVHAHFAPCLDGKEPGDLDAGLFKLETSPAEECLYFGETGFIGSHHAYGAPVYRTVEILRREIIVSDYVDGAHNLKRLSVDNFGPHFSDGYGIVLS